MCRLPHCRSQRQHHIPATTLSPLPKALPPPPKSVLYGAHTLHPTHHQEYHIRCPCSLLNVPPTPGAGTVAPRPGCCPPSSTRSACSPTPGTTRAEPTVVLSVNDLPCRGPCLRRSMPTHFVDGAYHAGTPNGGAASRLPPSPPRSNRSALSLLLEAPQSRLEAVLSVSNLPCRGSQLRSTRGRWGRSTTHRGSELLPPLLPCCGVAARRWRERRRRCRVAAVCAAPAPVHQTTVLGRGLAIHAMVSAARPPQCALCG